LVSPKLSETIAHETGAKTLTFNPLEGLTQDEVAAGQNYLSIQRQNLSALRTALSCQ
jgi:ABC-type Zn uptake system ZnuABC Zn-binding protein ZnuA